MERLDLCELVNVFGGAPVGKAAGRVDIGPSRMSVVDLSREKLKEASRGFSRRCEQWRRPEVFCRRDNQLVCAIPCCVHKRVIKDVIIHDDSSQRKRSNSPTISRRGGREGDFANIGSYCSVPCVAQQVFSQFATSREVLTP